MKEFGTCPECGARVKLGWSTYYGFCENDKCDVTLSIPPFYSDSPIGFLRWGVGSPMVMHKMTREHFLYINSKEAFERFNAIRNGYRQ